MQKRLSFFEPFPAHVQSKFEKSTIMTLEIFFLKISRKASKNAEFHADFESVDNFFEKTHKKKVICKNVMEICTFFTFTHVRQSCFAYNFFWCIF
jgi:hypothetical protein